jgi:hypothetical protein
VFDGVRMEVDVLRHVPKSGVNTAHALTYRQDVSRNKAGAAAQIASRQAVSKARKKRGGCS